MACPKKQWLLAVKRGRSTRYYYGDKLGDLVTERVKVGDKFYAAPLTRGAWVVGARSGEKSYMTAPAARGRTA